MLNGMLERKRPNESDACPVMSAAPYPYLIILSR